MFSVSVAISVTFFFFVLYKQKKAQLPSFNGFCGAFLVTFSNRNMPSKSKSIKSIKTIKKRVKKRRKCVAALAEFTGSDLRLSQVTKRSTAGRDPNRGYLRGYSAEDVAVRLPAPLRVSGRTVRRDVVSLFPDRWDVVRRARKAKEMRLHRQKMKEVEENGGF